MQRITKRGRQRELFKAHVFFKPFSREVPAFFLFIHYGVIGIDARIQNRTGDLPRNNHGEYNDRNHESKQNVQSDQHGKYFLYSI